MLADNVLPTKNNGMVSLEKHASMTLKCNQMGRKRGIRSYNHGFNNPDIPLIKVAYEYITHKKKGSS